MVVAAVLVPALFVHLPHMRLHVARLPEGSGAVGADVVPALLVHRLHMRLQVARLPEAVSYTHLTLPTTPYV